MKTVFTEEHPVIEGILNSEKMTDDNKFLAIAEILYLEGKKRLWDDAKDVRDVDELFEWEDSELGSTFWAGVQDQAFTAEKRSC